jgi:hypothetical protein
MRALSPQEQRTIKFGVFIVVLYLVLFFGFQGWRAMDARRRAYGDLVREAQVLKQQSKVYQDRALVLKKLMEEFRMDPAKLSRTTLVAQASAAVQNAARAGGVQVGPMREGAGRTSNKEAASIQLEAMGPPPQLLKFLHQLEGTGYPVVVDSVQLGSDANRPGPMKMSLVIVVLDFEQWQKPEGTNAKI